MYQGWFEHIIKSPDAKRHEKLPQVFKDYLKIYDLDLSPAYFSVLGNDQKISFTFIKEVPLDEIKIPEEQDQDEIEKIKIWANEKTLNTVQTNYWPHTDGNILVKAGHLPFVSRELSMRTISISERIKYTIEDGKKRIQYAQEVGMKKILCETSELITIKMKDLT